MMPAAMKAAPDEVLKINSYGYSGTMQCIYSFC